MVILAVSLCPLLLIGFITLRLAEDSLEKEIRGKHEAMLNSVSACAEMFTSARIRQLRALAELPQVQSLDPAKFRETLELFLIENPFFRELTVLASDGSILDSLKPNGGGQTGRAQAPGKISERHDALGLSVSAHLGTVLKSREAMTLSNFPDRTSEKPLLFMIPVSTFDDPTTTVGALYSVAFLDGVDIQGILDFQEVASSDFVCIVDRAGAIVARKGGGLSDRAVGFSGALQDAAGNQPEEGVITRTVLNEGREFLVSSSFSRLLGCRVLMGKPTDESFRLVRTYRENLGFVVLLAVVLSLGAAWFLASSISRRVTDLTQGLIRVKEGTYTGVVETSGDDEIAEAGEALNQLSSMLQKKMTLGSIWEKLTSPTTGRMCPKSQDGEALEGTSPTTGRMCPKSQDGEALEGTSPKPPQS